MAVRALSTLAPLARPVTRPSVRPSARVAKALVTSRPSTSTARPVAPTPGGSTSSTSASPSVTQSARVESVRISSRLTDEPPVPPCWCCRHRRCRRRRRARPRPAAAGSHRTARAAQGRRIVGMHGDCLLQRNGPETCLRGTVEPSDPARRCTAFPGRAPVCDARSRPDPRDFHHPLSRRFQVPARTDGACARRPPTSPVRGAAAGRPPCRRAWCPARRAARSTRRCRRAAP